MRTCGRFPALCAALALLGASAASGEPAPRIPVEAFFSNPTFSSPRLSPDGKYIAVLFSEGDHQFVLVRTPSGSEARSLAELEDPETRLNWLEWANPGRILLSATERNKHLGERFRLTRLFGVDREGGRLQWLGERWPKRGQAQWEVQLQDESLSWLPEDPDHVLISYRDPAKRTPSVKRMDVHSGRLWGRQRAMRKVDQWHADPQGRIRAAEGWDRTRYTLFARVDPDDDLRKLHSHDVFTDDPFEFAGFHPDPTRLYVFANHEGRAALFEFDIESAELGPLVFAHPDFDVGPAVYDEVRRKVVGVSYTVDEPEVHYIDQEARAEHQRIDRALHGVFGRKTDNEIVSATLGGAFMIVRASCDTQPPVYYFYDREHRAMTLLLEERPEIPSEQLAPMRRVRYAARDGLEIAAYLTVPKGMEARKLPVIVLPHGGPWARDWKRYDAEVQLFANRGFAVFQMNFRGSTGYGSTFERKGYREWGQAIQDDITDGVEWLIEQGIADPDRIGIYGASYGGYSAMMGLVKTPELYRAGASYAGVMDIETWIQDARHYLWALAWQDPMVGGGWRDHDRLREHSPLRRAGRIRVPVLLAHGADDMRVHVKHSRYMAEALRDRGKQVEYLEFEDEIHGFLLERSRTRFYERLVAFFEENLAPRAPAPDAEAPAPGDGA